MKYKHNPQRIVNRQSDQECDGNRHKMMNPEYLCQQCKKGIIGGKSKKRHYGVSDELYNCRFSVSIFDFRSFCLLHAHKYSTLGCDCHGLCRVAAVAIVRRMDHDPPARNTAASIRRFACRAVFRRQTCKKRGFSLCCDVNLACGHARHGKCRRRLRIDSARRAGRHFFKCGSARSLAWRSSTLRSFSRSPAVPPNVRAQSAQWDISTMRFPQGGAS